MQSQLSSIVEVAFSLASELEAPAFLRRKSAEGRRAER